MLGSKARPKMGKKAVAEQTLRGGGGMDVRKAQP